MQRCTRRSTFTAKASNASIQEHFSLSPTVILNQATRPKFHELPFLHVIPNQLSSKTEEQYRKIVFVNWTEQPAFSKHGLVLETEKFWVGVRQNESFRDLANYVFTCLTTHVSNAVVERMFSLVTNIKTKPRNRLQLSTLEAIVRIRSDMIVANKCCREFIVTKSMIQLFDSKNLYASTPKASTSKATSTDIGVDQKKRGKKMFYLCFYRYCKRKQPPT
ncbi:Zinc finger mym-type protein 1 [Plakobranchus ocellatus]|uniref:Zinc finger mym-type protein 1 n=1 Tax=Plakobranchus ocellatus TaxID=259542 RepID=A0AAV3ZK62_9GAST|nr:Zinc finger mym-type protein 1 [Plakobranchus ocellatus]